MKKNIAVMCVLCLAGVLRAETLRVQVQTGQVRSTPSFLGQVVATVSYGQAVESLETQGPWQHVRTIGGKVGWMHNTALTTKRITSQASGATVSSGASGDELALAGKGFSSDVEASFRSAHAEIDFTWVDRMATLNASPAQIREFVKAGGLKQNGGAQ